MRKTRKVNPLIAFPLMVRFHVRTHWKVYLFFHMIFGLPNELIHSKEMKRYTFGAEYDSGILPEEQERSN